MFEIDFYKNRVGRSPIIEYLLELNKKAKTSKEHRVRLKKIIEYMDILAEKGTRAGETYVKHIVDDIWELRPTNDRVFFFFWKDDAFVMLHHYIKKTTKMPQREIDQAKRNQADFLERSE